jgi:hypothetical protein
MYTYKVGEDTYTLPENEVEGFLQTFPDALLIEEDLEKTNGSQTEDATASQVDTASKSEDTSLEFPTVTDNPETIEKAKEAGLDVVPGARQEGDTIKGVTLPEVEIIPLEKQQENLTKEIEEYNAEMKNATNVVNTFYNQNIAPYVGEDKLLPADFNKETLKEFNDLRTAYFKVEDLSKDFEAKQLDLNERKEVYRKTGYDLQDAIAEAEKIKLSSNSVVPKALIPYLSGAQAVTLELEAGLVDFVDNYGYKPLAALATGKTVEEIIEEGEYEIPTEKLSYAAAKLRSHMTEYRDEDGKALDYVDLFQKGEIGKGAQVLSEQAFSNIPSLALSISFPVLGSAALGASVSGSGFEEDLKNRPDATVSQLYASNTGKGLSEWGTEFLGGTLFRGINRLRKAGASEAVVKEFAENYVANTTKKIAVGGFGEGATEGVNSAIQQSINEAVFDDEISTTEFVRTVVHDFGIGAALGGPASGVTSAATRIQKEQAYNALAPTEFKKQQFEIAKMLDSRVKQLETASANEKADLEQDIKDLNNVQVANKKALYRTFDTMNNKELKTYAQNLDIVNKEINKAKRKNADEVVKQKAEIAINNAFKANNEIIDQATNRRREKLFENVSLQAEALKEEGVNVDIKKGNSNDFIDWRRDDESASFDLGAIEAMDEIIKNPSSKKEEVAEAKKMKESQTEQFETKEEIIKGESTRYGAIRQDGKGGLEIFINQESELRDGVMTTATHEFGHALLFATLQGDSAARKAFGDALLEGFDENGIAIEGTDFKRRLDQYTEAEGKSEEVFTLAAEAVQNGDIKFNDNLFSRLKDVVRRFTKNRTGLEYKFNNNQDVFNFFRDYVESVESGNINKDLIKAAAKGVKGKVLPSDIKPGGVEQFSKEASDKVQQIYQDQGVGGAMDIIDQFAPIVNRIVQKRSEAPNFDRQLLTDEINTGERGIFDLIQKYNPESGVPLAAYINKFLPARAIEASRRVLGEEFTDDVAEAKGVAAEEAVEQQPERKTKLKVLADQLNVADKVKSEVAEANIDPNTLTNFKNVPNAAINTVGELLGISPAKIKSKANLTAAEVASAQRWFNKNAQFVIDALPQGFDAEGKATGVPKTVLEALYTKREARAKTKAGLRTQVKRPNIKNSELLELVDVIDGKPTRNRNTSARIIALSDLLGKVMTNQEVRQTFPGVERVRSGMSEVMFSKTDELIQVNPEFEGDLKNISKLLNTFIDEGIFKHNTVEQIDLFYEQVENVWAKNLPKDLITKTVLRPSNRILPNKGKDTITVDGVETTIDDYYTKKRDEFIAREDVKYGKAFSDEGADYKYGRTYGSMFGLTAKDVSKANSNGAIARINKENLSMHKQLWQRVNESIKADPKNAKAWGNYFSLVGQDVTHPHRMGAEMIGWTTKPKGYKGKLYEWEHAMPATRAYLYLMEASLDKNINFESAYDLVIDNFKLIALDKADDMKLKAAGRQTSMGKGWTVFDNWYDRYFDKEVAKQGGIDPKGIQGLDGRTFDQVYNVNIEGAAAITLPIEDKASISQSISNVRPVLAYSKESRGMSTFDFDETLIIDGENFVTATKDSDVVKIPSDKWPIDGPRLAEEGYKFDFSDFANVRGGKEGPLLQKMKNQIKKYGPSNVFVLTARQQEAAEPIHKWLRSQGINIPLENITGLGKSEGDAKAQWFIDKYAEGYNDMYFVDDALPNVKAVKHVFDQLDVKGKSVQARIQFSKDLSSEVNKMIERKKGTGAKKVFSSVVGKKRGKNIGKYRFFVPPSADDFAGLLYDFYGKGKQGDRDMKFMKKALLDPFARADREMSMARMSILDDYKTLRKELPNIKKKLGKIIDKDTGFTFDNAVRVYLFDKAGYEVPGISKRDLAYLKNVVNTDQDLRTFADALGLISKKKEGYIKPGENWSVETVASDLENIVNKIGRKQYLAEFIENKNIIFSPENMNKIEAVYGTRFRSALEDSLYRMENGTNRSAGRSYGQSWTNWVNGSVGAIMFFNARSAVLQTLSTVNFINYDDNNIFAAGKALANQKQYWSDFSTLFNSDFLKARRAGLQINVNEAELASAVAGAQNKAKAALAYLLKKGFLPTQIADSFAIASGGSTFYRNRINTYVKQGMDQKAAEEKAFLDFQEIAQETQQSSRPDRISQQQASPLGRLILAFANTPMQYNRLIKKAALDLANGRGDWRSNMSRILYYGAIQNVIFASLQQAIFALSFDDEDDEKVLDQKTMRVLNGTIDTLLRGSGVTGAAVATIKNVILEIMEQSEKGFRADYGEVIVEGLQVSPPMGSKARKVYGALKTYKFNREVMGEMDTFDYNNPIWDAVGNVTSATTNVPLDRLIRKTDNIREAFNQENSAMQRMFLTLGWSAWDLRVGERVVVNKGRDNEYVKFLPLKQQAQKEAEKKADERAKKEKEAKQQRCTKIKSDGTRCKVMTNKPKTRCHYHD